MDSIPDVDIDVVDHDAVISLVDHVVASQLTPAGDLVKHNTGIYLQDIPRDFSGLSAFPYDTAEDLEYYKIDVIPYGVYKNVASRKQLDELVDIAENDFPYEVFQDDSYFAGNTKVPVTHLGNYHDLCCQYPPHSVLDVATLIALIRPAKNHMIGQPWENIVASVWKKEGNGYLFKKSHAIGYALVVMVDFLTKIHI